jgi:uridine phosphorylase
MLKCEVVKGLSENDVLFNPEDFLEYEARRRGVNRKAFQIPERLMLVYQSNAFKYVKKFFGKNMNGKTMRWLYGKSRPFLIGNLNDTEIGAFRAWIGAPAAAIMLEELIACGAKKIFEVGMAGGLQSGLKPGDLIVVTEAIRDEGTSNHYFAPEVKLESSHKLRNLLIQELTKKRIKYSVGPVWTTDGVYRETKSKFLKFRNQGVLAVNMETSALFAVAKYRNVEIASAQVISDVLTAEGWLFAFSDKKVLGQLRKLLKLTANALAKS